MAMWMEVVWAWELWESVGRLDMVLEVLMVEWKEVLKADELRWAARRDLQTVHLTVLAKMRTKRSGCRCVFVTAKEMDGMMGWRMVQMLEQRIERDSQMELWMAKPSM